jgi:hypothetical protein
MLSQVATRTLRVVGFALVMVEVSLQLVVGII